MGTIRLSDEELGCATSAAALTWLARFYPDIAVAREKGSAALEAADRSTEELMLIWRTSLLNEMSFIATAPSRRSDIEELAL